MDLRELNQLIKETVDNDFRKNNANKKPQPRKELMEALNRAKLLIEGEDAPAEEAPAAASSVDSMDPTTDINKLDPKALAAAAFGGPGAEKLHQAMLNATGWAGKALPKAGVTDAASMGNQAKAIFGSEEELEARLTNINTALAASEGFDKSEMPAFEKNDYAAIKDALDATDGGELAVDFQDEYKEDVESVETYHAQQTGESEDADAEQEQIADSFNRWGKLAGIQLLKEINTDARFPFAGAHSVMQGAANRGDSKETDFDLDSTSGLAKTFLTKGEGTGDKTSVSGLTDMANSQMKPTQTNIKAAKSMLFAFANSGLDMEGSFADQDGNILDGHHRWSGQHLRTGGTAQHKGVHIITRPSGMGIPEFLTMLTAVGTALGRPTKK